MKLNTKLFIAGAAALLGSTAALAQTVQQAPADGTTQQEHQFRHHGRHHGFLGPRMVEKLGLTSAQQTQLASLKSNMKAEVGPVRSILQTRHAELKALWSAPTKDRNAILAKEAEIDQQKGIIRTAMVDFRIAFGDLLTPQQKAMLTQMRADRAANGFGHRRG
ncbi:MAG TPA: periplasmic heavy metal sensor [Myxococcales bacterium]|nr:periplasmic heavy metal sensor [Myxococcales bacterium]